MRSCRVRLAASAGLLTLLGGTGAAADPLNQTCEQPTGPSATAPKCPTHLHPGDSVFLPGFLCTLNFLWRGSDGHRYMGTAGHCTVETRVGDRVEAGSGGRIGVLAYRVFDSRTQGQDFALIRLDPGVKASPQMRYWGGPTKAYTAMSDQAQLLRFAGQATGISYAAPNRELLATAVTRPEVILVTGAASFNDSGAGVITTDGQAAGVITALASDDAPARTSGSGGLESGEGQITRIPHAVSQAEKALRIRLTLQTAQLRDR